MSFKVKQLRSGISYVEARGGNWRIISYHTVYIISYQKFIVRPLLREPRPRVHYKSQPNAKTPREKTQKSTSVKSLTKIV